MVLGCVSLFLCGVATFLIEGGALVSIKSVDEFWSVTLPLLGRSVGRLAVLNMFYNLVSVTDSVHARCIVLGISWKWHALGELWVPVNQFNTLK